MVVTNRLVLDRCHCGFANDLDGSEAEARGVFLRLLRPMSSRHLFAR